MDVSPNEKEINVCVCAVFSKLLRSKMSFEELDFPERVNLLWKRLASSPLQCGLECEYVPVFHVLDPESEDVLAVPHFRTVPIKQPVSYDLVLFRAVKR